MNTTERGDSIELGLLAGPISISSNLSLPPTASKDEHPAPPVDQNTAICVTIRISHRFATSENDLSLTSPDELRPKPSFATLLFRRILRQIGGTLKSDLPPPEFFSYGRTCEFDLVLDKMATTPATPLCTQNLPIEPTLEQLSSFGETLKGKRVTLYASAKGSFAHHLTSYLTAWGMDVTHVSPGGEVDGSTDQSAQDITQNPTPLSIDPARAELRLDSSELIFIDDDVDVLKDRLHALRCGNPINAPNVNPRKKPSLQANHRPRSSQQVTRLNSLRPLTTVVILHFTSLSNYKLVKDVVQSILALYATMAIPLPEVMIIPKPAGPRRFLTALHTSITKPTMDPFFIPIATSPMSPVPKQIGSAPIVTSPTGEKVSNQATVPGSQGNAAGITPSQTQTPLGKSSTRPIGSRTNSERSIKTLEGPGVLTTTALPPSPLALSDNVEYFSATAQKLGNSPSSGVVIQSPDGQTAGIYFHPRGKNGSRTPSSNNIEKEKVQAGPTLPRRQSMSRAVTSPNKEDTMSFSYLFAGPQKTTSAKSTPSPPDIPIPDVREPSPSPPSGPPIVVPSPVKIITTSLDSQHLKPSTPSPSRRASEDNRGIQMSPAVGPGEGSPTKRSSSKKPFSADTKDAKNTASPSKQKGKISSTGDANVVPPISVLIVDGM